MVTRSDEVQKEWDAVGPTDERVFLRCAEDADKGGIAGANEILEEDVVGEAALQGSIGEDEGSFIVCSCYHFLSLLVDAKDSE